MSATLTPEQRATLKNAAYGAVVLMSMVEPKSPSFSRESKAGSQVLYKSAGLVGDILSSGAGVKVKGRTAAELADWVLPDLASTIVVLHSQDPGEAENYRATVAAALREAAAACENLSSDQSAMIDKMHAALGATG